MTDTTHPADNGVGLSIDVVESQALAPPTLHEIVGLCSDAYEEDFSNAFDVLGPGVHVLGSLGDRIVSHAMWVTRALQPAGCASLRTAYVEAVATRLEWRRRGFASGILRRLALEIRGYQLGALSPADEEFYARLGWETWRGPLFIRTGGSLEPTPDEGVMILRLPSTPADLDLGAPLSAEWRAGEVW